MPTQETDPLIPRKSSNQNGTNGETFNTHVGPLQTKTESSIAIPPDDNLRDKQRKLLLAMGLILPYLGLVTALLCANNFDQDTVIEAFYFLPFHMYEFWGGVYFALVEGYVLLVADEESFRAMDPGRQSAMVHLLSVNIITSVVAASLFTLIAEIFEVPSHYIEYASQVTVTLLDAFFMTMPTRMGGTLGTGSDGRRQYKRVGIFPKQVQTVVFVVLVLMDFAKFFLYAEIIHVDIGNERSSHYVEFVVEILNSLWAFWYIKAVYMQSLQQQGTALPK